MFRTTFKKLLSFAAVCGFAVTPIFAGGHGGGGHGGGGHGGGGHGGGGHGGGGSHSGGGGHFGGGGHIGGGEVVQRVPSMGGGAVG